MILISYSGFLGAVGCFCIGYICHKAVNNGSIVIVENNNIMYVDPDNNQIDIIGVNNERRNLYEIDQITKSGFNKLEPFKYKTQLKGFGRVSNNINSASKGAGIKTYGW